MTAWCILAAVIAIVKAGTFVTALFTIALSLVYVLFMIFIVQPFLRKLGTYIPIARRSIKRSLPFRFEYYSSLHISRKLSASTHCSALSSLV